MGKARLLLEGRYRPRCLGQLLLLSRQDASPTVQFPEAQVEGDLIGIDFKRGTLESPERTRPASRRGELVLLQVHLAKMSGKRLLPTSTFQKGSDKQAQESTPACNRLRTPVPTGRKPDPLQGFKERVSSNEPFGTRSRMSTPYKTDGGERTYFESPGMHRAATSATPQDTKRNTGLYETPHAYAAAAANAKRNGKGSPEKRQPNLAGMYVSSSSSSSSSEDEEPSVPSAKARPTQVPKSRRGRMPAGAHRQTGFNLYARVEDAGDEPMAPQAGLGTGYYTGHRRHSAIDLEKASDFHNDDAKHDTEQSQQTTSAVPSGVSGSQSDGPKPSLSRSKSWQEKWGDHKDKWGSPPRDKNYRPAVGDQAKTPMYASQRYTHFSSHQSLHSPCPLDKRSY